MRFTRFGLMPWPQLPDDFRDNNRSVWVDIPQPLYDPKEGRHDRPVPRNSRNGSTGCKARDRSRRASTRRAHLKRL